MKESDVNFILFKELYQNRWKIFLTTLFFVSLAVIIHFITPKKYTANAIVYPTSSNSIDEIVNNPTFGFEIQADRTIQLFESQMMKDKIVSEFDLINYYELDTNSNSWFSKLNNFYARDISFSRTKYQSVVVSVTMKDPVLAAEIANLAISYLDTIHKALFDENLNTIRQELINNIELEQESLDQLLIEIINTDSTLATSNPIASNKLNQLKFNQQKGQSSAGDAIIMEVLANHPSFLLEKQINDYYINLNSLNSLKNKLAEVEETIKLPFPGLYIVSKARPDETPTSPKLLWNLVFGVFIGLIVSIGFVLLRSNYISIKSRLKG